MEVSQSKGLASRRCDAPVYIKQYNTINAAGDCAAVVLNSLVGEKAHLKDDDTFGAIGRLPKDVLSRLSDLRGQSVLKDYDDTTLLAVHGAEPLVQHIRDPSRCGVVIGSSRGNTHTLEGEITRYAEGKPVAVTASPSTTMGSIAAGLARFGGLGGLQLSVSSACTSSLQALIVGGSLMRSGVLDECVVGGAECATSSFTSAILRRVRIYHRGRAADYRPFGACRSGMVLGDGVAVQLLSLSKEHAVAEVMGVGATSETASMTGISPEGGGLAAACRAAIVDAGLNRHDIAAVVAHGAGTRKGDAAEIEAYRQLFGAKAPPITCDKWCYGHVLGAASSSAINYGIALSGGTKSRTIFDQEFNVLEPWQMFSVPKGSPVLVAALGFGGSAAAAVIRSLPAEAC